MERACIEGRGLVVKLLGGSVNLGDVGDEVAHSGRVTPLVVVPGDELDEVSVERDTGLGVEGRRGRVSGEVGRDDLVLGVGEDALELRGLGRLLDDGLDLVAGGSTKKRRRSVRGAHE